MHKILAEYINSTPNEEALRRTGVGHPETQGEDSVAQANHADDRGDDRQPERAPGRDGTGHGRRAGEAAEDEGEDEDGPEEGGEEGCSLRHSGDDRSFRAPLVPPGVNELVVEVRKRTGFQKC